ncbi:MAG: hypothetical protein J2P43_01120 [Candidatus Dormibacteraeota bacterium]|nr:hypothetical protein [Candidatus Dormibacteraeota bacterium]
MESRGNARRERSEPAGRHADQDGPGPLFEAAGDELDAPEHEGMRDDLHGYGDEGEEEDDFDQPHVIVTHSLHGQRARAERESETGGEGGRESADAVHGEAPAEAPGTTDEDEGQDEGDEQDVTQEAEIAGVAPEPAPPTEQPVDAEAEPEPEPTAPPVARRDTRFSPDGEWWWNGAYWLPAVSHDGLWRWDGSRWMLQVASGLEPERLVEGLNELAEIRYRRRGLLLARHANDWPVPPELTRPVAEATEILEQRNGTERRLQAMEAARSSQQRRMGGFLGRPSDDERQRLRNEIATMNRHLEPRLLQIGRDAPVPTFREADEVFETAQHLAAAAREVTACHEAVLAAQAEWQARVASATADLEQRIAERDARIAEAEVGVREAEARREHRIADAWRRLAEVRMPGKGEHLASFGPVHLFAARIEMPNAAGPAAGARAVIGSAGELTKAEPGALEDLFLVGDSGAADLHWAETNGDPTPYLLVVTESGSALMPCGENEGEARRFAHQVAAAAATADAMREARRARLAEATDTVRKSEQDRSEIEAALAHRTATEQDPDLLQAIEGARDRLAFEREETTEIDQTGAVLQGVLDRLTTAPKPLPRADAS